MTLARSAWAWFVALTLAGLLTALMGLLIVPTLGWARRYVAGPALGLWGRWSARLAGIELRITGAEKLRERKARVVLCNHSSALDMICIAALAPSSPTAVAKAELRWLPPINLSLWLIGTIFVERGTREQAVASLRRGAERVRREQLSLLVAPEGTRARDGRLGAFKTGSFHLAKQAQAEIVPVVIVGAHALCPPTGFLIEPGVIHIDVKDPIAPGEDPRAQAREVEELYRSWVG